MSVELERIIVRLVGDATEYLRMLQEAKAATLSATVDMKDVMNEAAHTYSRAATIIGGVLAAGLGFATKQYADFNQAMTESLAIMKVTEGQTMRMEEQVLRLAQTSKFAPAELAGAYYFLASAGLDAEQTIAALPSIMNFAQAGMIDMKIAAELAANALSAMGLKVKDAEQNAINLTRVTDVMAKASKISNATTLQFAKALSADAAPSLRAFNKSIEEGTAVLAVYADQGIKNEVAGGHLGRSLRFIADRAIRNQRAFRQLGLEVFDAGGNMRHMADIIQNMEQIFGGMSDKTRAQALEMLGFEARIQRAIIPLLGFSQKIREYNDTLNKAGGTSKQISENQMKSFTNQMKAMWHSVQRLAISIGEELVPTLILGAKVVRFFVDMWVALPKSIKTIAVAIASVTAALFVMTGAIVIAGVTFNILFGGVGMLIGFASVLYSSFLGLFGGMAIGLGIVTGLFEYIKNQAVKAWEWIKPVRQAFVDFANTVMTLGGMVWDSLILSTRAMWNVLLQTLGIANNTFDWRSLLANAVVGIKMLEYALLNLAAVMDFVYLSWKLGIQIYSETVQFFFLVQFPAFLMYVSHLLLALFIQGWKNIEIVSANYFSNLVTIIKSVGNTFYETFKQIFDNLVLMFTNIGGIIHDIMKGTLDSKDFKEIFRRLTEGIEFKAPEFKIDRPLRQLSQGLQEFQRIGFEMPQRVISQRERFLRDLLHRMGVNMREDFNRFFLRNLSPANRQAVNAAQALGEQLGGEITEGATEELKKLDAAAYRSVEALSRFLDFQDRILNPEDQLIKRKRRESLHFDAADMGSPDARNREETQIDLLKKIVNNTKRGEDLARIEVRDADLQ